MAQHRTSVLHGWIFLRVLMRVSSEIRFHRCRTNVRYWQCQVSATTLLMSHCCASTPCGNRKAEVPNLVAHLPPRYPATFRLPHLIFFFRFRCTLREERLSGCGAAPMTVNDKSELGLILLIPFFSIAVSASFKGRHPVQSGVSWPASRFLSGSYGQALTRASEGESPHEELSNATILCRCSIATERKTCNNRLTSFVHTHCFLGTHLFIRTTFHSTLVNVQLFSLWA